MAFLHPHSGEALRSELDLWTVPPTQTALEEAQWQHYKPVTSISQSNSIEFCVPGAGTDYIDPAHTLLYIKVKIVKQDGTDIAATDENDAGPINYLLNSMWSQCDVSLNQKLISQSALTYPARAYMESLLAYDAPAKYTHMGMRFWYKDQGNLEAITAGGNAGLDLRRKLMKSSKPIEMLGPIHADFFNQDRFLINNVEMRIKLTRSRDSFVLMSTAGTEKLEILDASLMVRKVHLSPTVLLAHAAALERAPAKYPLTRVQVQTVTIPLGLRDKSIPNLHIGQIPKRIVIGFIENQAHNGSYKHNPHNFQHFDLNYLSLYVDAKQYPAQPLTPDFANNSYVEAYNTLFAGTGIHFKDEGNDITYTEYSKGFTLYAFDVTPDLSAHESHWNLQKQGVVRLELRFAAALPSAVNCIVYSEFNNLVEIDKNRSVIVDYSV